MINGNNNTETNSVVGVTVARDTSLKKEIYIDEHRKAKLI